VVWCCDDGLFLLGVLVREAQSLLFHIASLAISVSANYGEPIISGFSDVSDGEHTMRQCFTLTLNPVPQRKGRR
jgi:hypothetical protein